MITKLTKFQSNKMLSMLSRQDGTQLIPLAQRNLLNKVFLTIPQPIRTCSQKNFVFP